MVEGLIARLLQGDVGSGKTIVAALAALADGDSVEAIGDAPISDAELAALLSHLRATWGAGAGSR